MPMQAQSGVFGGIAPNHS